MPGLLARLERSTRYPGCDKGILIRNRGLEMVYLAVQVKILQLANIFN